MTPLSDRLSAGEHILIDGGTGTLIERMGGAMTPGIWCGGATLTDPDIVRAAHEAYIAAGAEVIIANTYACSRHVLAHARLDDRFEEANRSGIEVALEARAASGGSVTVAGSISTTEMGGALPPPEVARVNFADQARVLADAGAELLVLEMMREIDQTLIALDAALATGLPVWVGFSAVMVEDEPHLFLGHDRLADGVDAVADRGVELVAIMHTETAEVDRCLDVVGARWSGPVGVYAHSGRFEPPHWVYDATMSPGDYADAANGWIERGVQVVGGCCGIHPEHIAALRPLLHRPA